MSSNPFRRSKLPEQLPPTTPIATDVGGEAPSKRTKKKRVKIQTPPDSPEAQFTTENGARRLSAADASGRAGSPPPPATAADESDDESDSTATADSELEEALKNTRRNSGSLPSPDKAPANAMRAQFNPFAKTLASSDAGFGLSRAENVQEQGNGQKQGGGSGRAALDVDAFKNILLTGSATPSPPSSVAGATATPSAAPNTTFSNKPHDSSSSNTDTSSIFDRNYGMQLESPRNSFDDYESASESDDDEKSGLMGEGRSDDLAPPAPPKPKIRGPQTVSFADFDQSIPEGFQSSGPRTPPVNTHITGILRPSTPRSSSDLNKPLPPPPAETYDTAPPSVPDKSLPPSQQPTPTIVAEDATPKKAHPPPPTRRKAGDTTRPRSSSNLSQEPSYPPDDDEATSKSAPPPPPMRKPQAMASVSGVSSEPSSEKTSPSQSTTEVPKAVPPPPPRRHPSKTGPSPRLAEPSAQRPGDAFLAAVAPSQPGAPPAPPPRRAGGSKRSSMDGAPDSLARRVSSEHSRRTSGNSFDSDRSTFLSSLQQVSEPGENNEQPLVTPMESQRDILADMTAFQAEIEALRLQSGNSR